MIRSIILLRLYQTDLPPFKIDTINASLRLNEKILHDFDFDYDLDNLIASHKNNFVSPESELRDPWVLAPLLNFHPYWKDCSEIMLNKVSSELKDISEEQRIEDLEAVIKRCNHKSALSKEKLLKELVIDEMVSSFQVPIPIEVSKKIKNKVITPYALAD